MPATLPYIDDSLADPDMRAQFAEIQKIMGDVPPLVRILATVPALVPAFMGFAGPVIMGDGLSIDLKVLALLRVSEINNCNYCRGYYAPLAEQLGLVGDRRAAIAQDVTPLALFNPKETALLALADEMTNDIQAKPATVAKAREALGDAGTLEAMMTIGLFNLINRVAGSAGLPLEG